MLLILMLAADSMGAARDFYIAVDGSDSDSGTRERPFASLEAGRDAIRRVKQESGLPAGGITVWIGGGDYLRDKTFDLRPEDSGSKECQIVYRAAPNVRARLIGGKLLRGFGRVTSPEVTSRLPETARSSVLQTDLRALGISTVPQMRSRGFGRALTPAHPELFFSGEPMTLARWPNQGQWEKIAAFVQGQGDDHGGKIGVLTAGFNYTGDRPRQWKDTREVWVHGYWAYDWANSYERIESIDLERRLIKTAPPHGLYGFRQDQRFYYLNVLEELDQPGEWCIDREKGVLYFWPPKRIDTAEAVLSTLEGSLFSLEGVSHVTLRGLVLEATRGHAVSIHGGAHNLVAGCVIRLIGNYGVWIEGGRANGVGGSDIEQTGDGGVALEGGDRRTLAPGGHFVENCHFQKQGRWSRCYVPAVLMGGVGHRVAHNLIHDHPHCAILYTGNEHIIELNEIHHVALETGDVGAIYTGRDWTYRGNVIRNNFIHHTGGVGMGSMGAYMDDCVSGTEIVGNVFYEVSRAAFLGGGRDHKVENNIFVDCHPAVQLDGRGMDKSPVWHNMVYDFMKKRLEEMPQDLYRQRYPAITNLDRYYQGDPGVPPENNVVARNICSGGEWTQVGWHANPKWLGLRDNLVDKNPGFVDPAKMDFRLRPDSPAWRMGFQPIPFEKIGLQSDELRRETGRVRR